MPIPGLVFNEVLLTRCSFSLRAPFDSRLHCCGYQMISCPPEEMRDVKLHIIETGHNKSYQCVSNIVLLVIIRSWFTQSYRILSV